MSLDLTLTNVTLEETTFHPMLVNLQANILKFHGRRFAHHLFIQFYPENVEQAKQWIMSFACSKITSSYTQLYDARRRKDDKNYDGGTIYNLSLSNHGYNSLNIHSDIQTNPTFSHGLRGSAEDLLDKVDTWQDAFKDHQIDMLIIVADDSPQIAAEAAESIIKQIAPFALCVLNQRGNVLKMKDTGVGIEHFSYADGVSQPMYLKDEIDGQPQQLIWNDATPLKMVLVKEDNSENDFFGSYFVFRKLEQHVRQFKDAEGDNGFTAGKKIIKINGAPADVKDNTGKPNVELAGAMLIGRFENSTPVVLSKGNAFDPSPIAANVTNNFDYSDDTTALKCPFHAHVRLVNPRKGNPTQDPDEIRSHRITRRAIPYDDHERPYHAGIDVNERRRFDDEKILEITDHQLQVHNQPDGRVGLLFMCYQSDIKSHFEELQGQWANTGIIDPATKSIGEDSLITQGEDAPRSMPQQWDKPKQSDKYQFSNFVRMRGGEYFYTPSINFLKNL